MPFVITRFLTKNSYSPPTSPSIWLVSEGSRDKKRHVDQEASPQASGAAAEEAADTRERQPCTEANNSNPSTSQIKSPLMRLCHSPKSMDARKQMDASQIIFR